MEGSCEYTAPARGLGVGLTTGHLKNKLDIKFARSLATV
jgi:hypothetical protein